MFALLSDAFVCCFCLYHIHLYLKYLKDFLPLIYLRLVPVLVNGMKYSEIDIILLKVS